MKEHLFEFNVQVNIEDPIGVALDKEAGIKDILRNTYQGRNYQGKHILSIEKVAAGDIVINRSDLTGGATANVVFEARCLALRMDDIIPRVRVLRKKVVAEIGPVDGAPITGVLESDAFEEGDELPVIITRSYYEPNKQKISLLVEPLKEYEPTPVTTGGECNDELPSWTWDPALEKLFGFVKPRGIDIRKVPQGTWIQPNPLLPIVTPVISPALVVTPEEAGALWRLNMDNYGRLLSEGEGLKKRGEYFIYNG